MKKFILLIFITISTIGFGQKVDTLNYSSPGDELIKFEKQYSNGIVVNFIGVGVLLLAQHNDNKILMIAGGFLSLIGTAISINSHSHIRKAGLLLNQNGVGIKIKI